MEPDTTVDYILCECPLDALVTFVDSLTRHYSIRLIKSPGICLTMIRAEDSVENQEFYLGEALTTDCEVTVENIVGYGICLGDEPQRAYALAVLDAVIQHKDAQTPLIRAFLSEQRAGIQQREQTEFAHIQRTKVVFKLMEQA